MTPTRPASELHSATPTSEGFVHTNHVACLPSAATRGGPCPGLTSLGAHEGLCRALNPEWLSGKIWTGCALTKREAWVRSRCDATLGGHPRRLFEKPAELQAGGEFGFGETVNSGDT